LALLLIVGPFISSVRGCWRNCRNRFYWKSPTLEQETAPVCVLFIALRRAQGVPNKLPADGSIVRPRPDPYQKMPMGLAHVALKTLALCKMA
jgi:hypothetical protein